MEGLFKLLFYVVIIIVWGISNAAKKNRWEDNIPNFPKTPPPRRPPSKPVYKKPLRQDGLLSHQEKVKISVEARKLNLSYDELLARRRNELETARQRQMQPKKKPLPIFKQPQTGHLREGMHSSEGPKIEPETVEPILKTEPILGQVTKKQAIDLKSSIKEGIIWSIILGPPRSKLRYNGSNPASRR